MKVPVAQPLQLPAKIRKPVAEIVTAKASIGSGACGGNASNGITINASVNLRDLPVGRYFSIESMNGSIEERIRILRSFV
ncbi:hypothetical protein, partial [Proteus vulgaris]|uniref:hypothetical protein n=1 Tax=Proteus vulgaris TaxID=585 RepID=UPI0013D683D1